MRSIAGFRNRSEQTIVDTGLPGRPSTRARSLAANISGFPGRMAMRQKSMVKPCALSASCTRSWSPTEAPPSVIRMSCCVPAAMRSSISAGSSRAMSNSVASPPQPRTSAATAMPEDEMIWLRPTGSPGITSSSPVDRIATRGFRCTESHGRFMAAASAASRVVSRRPALSGVSPSLKSRPALRMCRPGLGASRIVILSPSALVSSWITIESAPIGNGPPVKMRTASPGFSAWS